MSVFVLDCSVTVAWLFHDEATPETDELLDRLKKGAALVPAIWSLEVGNVLTKAQRRNRVTAAQAASCLELVRRLPIEVDAETERRALNEVLSLARTERLTTYDAAYLELAMRRGLDLATRDKALVLAAGRVKVETLPG